MTASTISQSPQSIPQTSQHVMSSEEYLLKRNTHGNILVPFLENLGGAIGCLCATIAIWILASSVGIQVNWFAGIKLGIALGLLALGASSFIRFYGDEYQSWRISRNARALDKDRQNLIGELRMATERIQQLERDLSAGNRYSSLAMAEQLLREHFFENKPMNRDTAMARGWSRPNWTLAYKHLQNAGVVDGRGQFREDAISYEAAMGKALTATHGSGRYVRAKDGSMMKVDTYANDSKPMDEESLEMEELPTIEVSSRSNREVKQYPRQTSAYQNIMSTASSLPAPNTLAQRIGLGYEEYTTSLPKSQVISKAVYKG